MKICNRKELLKLKFRGLPLRQGEMLRSAKNKTKSSCNTPYRRGTTVSLKNLPPLIRLWQNSLSMTKLISFLSKASCLFTSQLYSSLFSSVMVSWYFTLVLFCTTLSFFLQTINGAGAPWAGHQRDEVWLKRTNWVLATLSKLGLTGRKQINEITKWVGVLVIAIFSFRVATTYKHFRIVSVSNFRSNTCKVECSVGVRAPKPA